MRRIRSFRESARWVDPPRASDYAKKAVEEVQWVAHGGLASPWRS